MSTAPAAGLAASIKLPLSGLTVDPTIQQRVSIDDALGKPIDRRIEALEQAAPDSAYKPDFSGLTDIELEVYRSACTDVGASAITPDEAAEVCGLATAGVPLPYPIHGEPSSHPQYLRVLIGGKISRLRWFGFPGHRRVGWERYLYVGPEGTLMRTDGIAVYPPG